MRNDWRMEYTRIELCILWYSFPFDSLIMYRVTDSEWFLSIPFTAKTSHRRLQAVNFLRRFSREHENWAQKSHFVFFASPAGMPSSRDMFWCFYSEATGSFYFFTYYWTKFPFRYQPFRDLCTIRVSHPAYMNTYSEFDSDGILLLPIYIIELQLLLLLPCMSISIYRILYIYICIKFGTTVFQITFVDFYSVQYWYFVNRYMPPVTPSTWKSTRLADHFSPVCPQSPPVSPSGPEALLEIPRERLAQLRRLLPLLTNQSEDCLYLNLYVPRAGELFILPIIIIDLTLFYIIYIHIYLLFYIYILIIAIIISLPSAHRNFI